MAKPLSYVEKAQKFDEDHPELYAYLKRMVMRDKRQGRRRMGIRTYWEIARWHFAGKLNLTLPTSKYRMNDHYTAYYARKLMLFNLELRHFFETRDSSYKEQYTTLTFVDGA